MSLGVPTGLLCRMKFMHVCVEHITFKAVGDVDLPVLSWKLQTAPLFEELVVSTAMPEHNKKHNKKTPTYSALAMQEHKQEHTINNARPHSAQSFFTFPTPSPLAHGPPGMEAHACDTCLGLGVLGRRARPSAVLPPKAWGERLGALLGWGLHSLALLQPERLGLPGAAGIHAKTSGLLASPLRARGSLPGQARGVVGRGMAAVDVLVLLAPEPHKGGAG